MLLVVSQSPLWLLLKQKSFCAQCKCLSGSLAAVASCSSRLPGAGKLSSAVAVSLSCLRRVLFSNANHSGRHAAPRLTLSEGFGFRRLDLTWGWLGAAISIDVACPGLGPGFRSGPWHDAASPLRSASRRRPVPLFSAPFVRLSRLCEARRFIRIKGPNARNPTGLVRPDFIQLNESEWNGTGRDGTEEQAASASASALH